MADLPVFVWAIVAGFSTDTNDLLALRLVSRSAHAGIAKPPSEMAKAAHRYLVKDNKNRKHCCVSFDSTSDSIWIIFEQDNRKPDNSNARKMTIWYEHKVLTIHRFMGKDSEYFEKKKWSDIVPSKKKLSIFNRVLQNIDKVSMYNGLLNKYAIADWLTTDWSECEYYIRYTPFYLPAL